MGSRTTERDAVVADLRAQLAAASKRAVDVCAGVSGCGPSRFDRALGTLLTAALSALLYAAFQSELSSEAVLES